MILTIYYWKNIKNHLLFSITSFKDYILVNIMEQEFDRLIILDAIRRDENRFFDYRKEVHKRVDDICKNYDGLIRTMRV